MYIMEGLSKNNQGMLTLGGISLKDIAKKYGTPAYVMDEDTIVKNACVYRDATKKYYDGESLILYASKAFSCKYIYKLVSELGLGTDVVSGGELYTALKAGMPAEKIYFHGNNKTPDEIKLAVDNNVGCFVVDNITELNRINDYAKSVNKTVDIAFRIKPGVEAHTHEFIMTGQIDSKFGVALETGEAEEAYILASKMSNINIVGVHCHIGSQIFDFQPFESAVETMLSFVVLLKEKHNIIVSQLNLGGGYGIKYTSQDAHVPYEMFISKISDKINKVCEENNLSKPMLLMEPGRSIVGAAGLTLYTVGNVKNIPNVRTYVSIDGGMSDNPRYILYNAEYEAKLVSNPDGQADETVTIAGKCCESGDIIIKDAKMPKISEGDLLAVLSTGAYNYSMSSNYNRIPRPPVVFVSGGKDKVVIERESYDDILKNDKD
ncbi:MAG: diaminopimelate decarboxylase [Eubacteriales bacterium]|nr:diaminopimelate decarboxylase [Eubacteriales bacterium]